MTSAPASRLRPFGEPHILEGEDGAAYNQLLALTSAAVKPVDIIDEMFIADVVSLQWEVLRWRRLKSSLIRARAIAALEKFLREKLDYELHREHFVEELAEILQNNLPDDQAEHARTLAEECVRNASGAVDTVNEVLRDSGWQLHEIQDRAQALKAEELVQEYARREPDAVALVIELLTRAGKSIDNLMADAVAERLDDIERIDRLTSIAESRRNAGREIDRRRAVLGEALRRSVRAIEDGEYEVIETTPAKGKDAA